MLDPNIEVDRAGLETDHDRDQVASHAVDLVDGAGLGDTVDLEHLPSLIHRGLRALPVSARPRA
jgi:hypothetical protein